MGTGTGSSARGVIGWIGQVVAWLVVLSTAGVLTVAVLVPRLGGATPYTVLTGSMAPGMPPGTLVVAKPVDPEDIGIGTVVTYQLESGKPAVVTHRVVAVQQSVSGETTFTTQGDANDAPDEKPVRPVQIRGERWYSVPYLGYVNNVLNGQQRQVAVYVVAGGLLAYALLMFAGAARGRRRGRGATPVESAQLPGAGAIEQEELEQERREVAR